MLSLRMFKRLTLDNCETSPWRGSQLMNIVTLHPNTSRGHLFLFVFAVRIGWRFAQEAGPNLGELSEDGVFMRPNVTNDEAVDPDYVQQSLVPLDSETHSGAGREWIETRLLPKTLTEVFVYWQRVDRFCCAHTDHACSVFSFWLTLVRFTLMYAVSTKCCIQ